MITALFVDSLGDVGNMKAKALIAVVEVTQIN